MASPFSRTTRALALETGRASRLALACAGVLLAAWTAWFVFGRVTLYEVSRRARLEAVVAARDVSPVEAGRLVSSRLQIGRRVTAGEVLVELDATQARLDLAEAEARLQALPARIAAAEAEAQALQASLAADRGAADAALRSARAREREAAAGVDYAEEKDRRMRGLLDRGILSDVEAYRYATDARRARSARDAIAAEAQKAAYDARLSQSDGLARLQALRQAIAGMQGDLLASRATAERLRAAIDARQVRAPADGVIGEAPTLAAGAYVEAGQKLATIVPDGRLTLVAEFPSGGALGRVRPGQTARLRLDGYPWAQYGVVTARVLRVASEPRGGLLRADLSVSPATGGGLPLRHGMAGAAEVAVERVSPAVLVLRAAGQALGAGGAA
ncbi:MAG: HlyD family efflux transporter periplasmic adaptor subunit [Phenylobacterium sp.]|uniref:HlyD family secretion protein n=1 Tax=Phenylobacterium sp. TaxID=1871053 RepID=UPI001A4008F7|nr:HlyD family efflux transporter periplasmic adaptor subunit [Phenylobacterium sp.]MBL8771702.1 HlyD family efflux transporter periplasmic adaptor subunit [Phenylobacterium sp.]